MACLPALGCLPGSDAPPSSSPGKRPCTSDYGSPHPRPVLLQGVLQPPRGGLTHTWDPVRAQLFVGCGTLGKLCLKECHTAREG